MTHGLRSFFLFSLFALYSCNNNTLKYHPLYHLAPKTGWMNDPNGLSFFKEEYHLFYQYNPYSASSPGIAHWGHAKSCDLIYWERLPIALKPDHWYDNDGVFSGSALVEGDTMYLYYTGNINHNNKTPDHEQYQNIATSTDGIIFTKSDKNPIINGSDYQPNIRDPKVWKHQDTYYMVLGNSFNNNTLGRVLLYTSKDKYNWKETSVLAQSNGTLGYMWECPDFFEMDGKFVLLFSPQGIAPKCDNYRNLYQTGYIIGDFDYNTYKFTEIEPFRELDHGHDFYATQTMLTKDGCRVMFAWNDMWDENYPESSDGFTGQMTLPRNLIMSKDRRLLQQPIDAIKNAIGKKMYEGEGHCGTQVKLENNVGFVEIRASCDKDFTLFIESEYANDTVTLSYEYKEGLVVLDRGGCDGMRRTKHSPGSEFLEMRMFIDRSSVEVFWDTCGYVTMSSRFFPTGMVTVRIAEGSYASVFSVSDMKRTI